MTNRVLEIEYSQGLIPLLYSIIKRQGLENEVQKKTLTKPKKSRGEKKREKKKKKKERMKNKELFFKNMKNRK